MRVIVCGSRTWTDYDAIRKRLGELDRADLVIVQGGARGADVKAKRWAQLNGVACEQFDADWMSHGRSAGVRRNSEMLNAGADLVVAFRSEGESRGTDHMVGIARARGVPVEVVR